MLANWVVQPVKTFLRTASAFLEAEDLIMHSPPLFHSFSPFPSYAAQARASTDPSMHATSEGKEEEEGNLKKRCRMEGEDSQADAFANPNPLLTSYEALPPPPPTPFLSFSSSSSLLAKTPESVAMLEDASDFPEAPSSSSSSSSQPRPKIDVPQTTKCRIAAVSPPARMAKAKTVRRLVSFHLQVVYSQLVSERIFFPTNIFERGKTADPYTVHPAIDSTGVVYAASELIRHRVPVHLIGDEHACSSLMQLSLKVRVAMAAALFLSYKMASEDTWTCGTVSISSHLMRKFLHKSEITSHDEARLDTVMIQAELDLLSSVRVHRIVEFNMCKLVEYKLQSLYEQDAISATTAIKGLSVASFYLNHCFRIGGGGMTEYTEVVETNVHSVGACCVAEAVLIIVIAHLNCSFSIHVGDIPIIHRFAFSSMALSVAKLLLAMRLNRGTPMLTNGFPILCSASVAHKALSLLRELHKPALHASEEEGREKEEKEESNPFPRLSDCRLAASFVEVS